jgi:predicted esterase
VKSHLLLLGSLLLLALVSAGCCARKKKTPAGLVELTTADGQKALVIYGTSTQKRVIVYLHGRCDDPRDALAAFADELKGQGHLVAPVGSESSGCINGATQWTGDLGRLDAQIRAAVAAAEAKVKGRWEQQEQVLIGYSQGAARGEDLLPAQPRFRRVIFLGSPEAPDARRYAGVTAAAFLAGEKDRRDLMMTGEQALRRAGKPVRFFLLPGAEHGDFGPQGGAVMAEALAFVLAPPAS